MQFNKLAVLAFAGYVAAQGGTQNLTATLAGQSSLSNLTSFLGLNPQLLASLSSASNITILAPSNNAFTRLASSPGGAALASNADLVSALLTYHVLNGTYPAASITNSSNFLPSLLTNQTYTNRTGGQVVEARRVGNGTYFFSGLFQNASVSTANINFTGGVIHVIESVLTLPTNVSDAASAAGLTAVNGALNATNLAGTVNTGRDLTIFAPSNEAFQSVGSALNLSTSDLVNILSYHVVNGTVRYSNRLTNGTTLSTVGGRNLTVTVVNGTTFVNAAKVVTQNLLVANGVVHVIDAVLNPGNTSGPASTATRGAPAYSGASSVTNVPFTSGQPTPTTTVAGSSAGANPAASTGGAASSSSRAAAMPMRTGAVGAAALFGAAGAVMAVF